MAKKKAAKSEAAKKESAAPKKMGRPTLYTKELGEHICLRLSKGESLRSICKDLTPEVEASRGLLDGAQKKHDGLEKVTPKDKKAKKKAKLEAIKNALLDIEQKKKDLTEWEEKRDGMPEIHTVLRWVIEGGPKDAPPEKQEFRSNYEIARAMWADCVFEETIEMADNAGDVIIGGDDRGDNARIAAVRVAIDTRRWALGRMAPKKFAEKIDITSNGKTIMQPRRGVMTYVVPPDPEGDKK